MDDVDGGASGICEIDDLLGANMPSHFDAFGLDLSNVDDSYIEFHVKF